MGYSHSPEADLTEALDAVRIGVVEHRAVDKCCTGVWRNNVAKVNAIDSLGRDDQVDPVSGRVHVVLRIGFFADHIQPGSDVEEDLPAAT